MPRPGSIDFLLVVAGAAGVLALVACSDGPTVSPRDVEATLEVVAAGLDQPVYLTSPPGDPTRLFVLEKAGRVRVIRDGELLTEPFLDIRSETSSGGERGLLGLAFHPDYASNGYVYLHHTDTGGDTRVVRYTAASDDAADAASASVILQVDQPYANHNGGQLTFGPDGYLYLGLGDGGDANDPDGNGQDPSTLLGSILRLDVDGGSPYAIPPDNPFASDPAGAPEVWAYGLRNPWRFSFDGLTGDLYVGDVGQNRLEEISYQEESAPGGANFGWNVTEGSECFQATECDTSGLTLPVYDYGHDDGACSVTGGYVYRGSELDLLRGRYFFGDYCTGFIRSFLVDGGVATDVQDHTADLGEVPGLASFGVDADRELYVVSIEGTVYRLTGS
ncbi:MAG: PQQ-dependent sugar dehydrogenase [Longimicrobiales bacterium]|nr:PQQ-dependent sugar dehydrogenase [Longimicrobiales bacterium]